MARQRDGHIDCDEGWTVETLRRHYDSILYERERRIEERAHAIEAAFQTSLKSLEKASETALATANTAVQKAESAAEKRFESVNEFRNTLSDQQRNLMPRSEVTVTIEALENQIASVAAANANKIDALEKQLDKLQAERLGVKGGWGYAVGVVGFLFILASLIVAGTAALKILSPADHIVQVPSTK